MQPPIISLVHHYNRPSLGILPYDFTKVNNSTNITSGLSAHVKMDVLADRLTAKLTRAQVPFLVLIEGL